MTPERSVFLLLKQAEPPTSAPWAIGEFYMTCDGPRTPFVRMGIATEEEARALIKEYEDAQRP